MVHLIGTQLQMQKCVNGIWLLLVLLATVLAEDRKWIWDGNPRTINDRNRSERIRDRELVEVFNPSGKPLFRPAQDFQPAADRPNFRRERLTENNSFNRFGPQTFTKTTRFTDNSNDNDNDQDTRPNTGVSKQYVRPFNEGNRFDQSRPTGGQNDQDVYNRPPGRQYPNEPFPRPTGLGGFGQGPINNQGGFNGPSGLGPNGFGPNGFNQNGLRPNGFEPIGQGINGFGPNGQGTNGFGPSGQGPNGFGPNGQGPNGFGQGPSGPGQVPILTGPVPSWEQGRGEGQFLGYDKCKCAHSFNCISPGIQFGQCDVGKQYCCHNSIHEGGSKLNHDGPGIGPVIGGAGIGGPGGLDRPFRNGERPIIPGGGGSIGLNRYGENRPVLVGPGGPTGIVSEGRPRPGPGGPIIGNNRPVLVGPGGPTGIVSEGRPRPGPGIGGVIGGGNRPVLVGPGGPTGIVSEGRPHPGPGGLIGGGNGPFPGPNGPFPGPNGPFPGPNGVNGFGGRPPGFGGGGNGAQFDDDFVGRKAGVFRVNTHEPVGIARSGAVKEELKKA